MAKWGRFDYTQLRKLQENLDKFGSQVDMTAFCIDCCHELAGRLLALVIPLTPVGKYPKSSGKKGGTLRRGWGAEKASAAKAYAESLVVTKSGNIYTIEIINPVEYASYVEFGHRTRGGNGWVEGRYMLTISEEKLERMSPLILEKLLQKKIKEVFNV